MRKWLISSTLIAGVPVLSWQLLLRGYADLLAGILALAMVALGIWLSARGMARLQHPDKLPKPEIESAYRYRNAVIALGVTGSGLLVFSWQSFLDRFINV